LFRQARGGFVSIATRFSLFFFFVDDFSLFSPFYSGTKYHIHTLTWIFAAAHWQKALRTAAAAAAAVAATVGS